MAADLWFSIDVGAGIQDRHRGPDGLTPAQRAIRDSCGSVPKHIRRSIDEYRVALGMVPLWGFVPSYEPGQYDSVQRRRRLDRERKRRQRARTKGVSYGR